MRVLLQRIANGMMLLAACVEFPFPEYCTLVLHVPQTLLISLDDYLGKLTVSSLEEIYD